MLHGVHDLQQANKCIFAGKVLGRVSPYLANPIWPALSENGVAQVDSMMAGTKGGVAERKQRKRPNSQSELGRSQSGSGSANDSIRLQALGAHVQALGRPINQGANALNVRIPPAVGTNVRVRHALAEAGSLTAHVTNGSHDVLLGFSYTISCLDHDDQEAIGDSSPQATMTP